MRLIPTLDTDDSAAAREAALLAAADAGLAACIAIVDASGVLLDLHRADGAKPHTVDLAMRKARTSALLGVETFLLERMAKEGRVVSGEVLALAGGVPTMHEGRCAGAVGVSGGSSEIDHQIAAAAAKAVSAELKHPSVSKGAVLAGLAMRIELCGGHRRAADFGGRKPGPRHHLRLEPGTL
jgi:glc operon protein GlcG